jgi:hypothetical protein
MDNETKIRGLTIKLAQVIEENQEREAQAVRGYTEQLGAIDDLSRELSLLPNEQETIDFLEKLREETEEKISDELNHQKGLLFEYVSLTEIPIAKE